MTTVKENGTIKLKYTYDSMGRLTREDNAYANKTYVYTYTSNGNISAKKTYAYTTGTLGAVQTTETRAYGNSNWLDQLTNINATAITYDSMGNPLNWHNASAFTWEGRKLKSLTKTDGTVISYAYDENGIRTGKTAGSENVSYVLDGTRILKEIRNAYTLTFLYDNSGTLIGFNYNNGTTSADYYYGIDNFGNINYIYDNNGNIVTTYRYDAWGKAISTTGTLAGTIGAINPYRYKSYYYDTDTGLYYLQSRYYDAQVQRFVSPDELEIMGISGGLYSYNLYAYCENDPVNYSDPTGCVFRFDRTVNKMIGTSLSHINPKYFKYSRKSSSEAIYIIKKYAIIILNAAMYYNVDAAVVAGVIYAEQTTHVNIFDIADVAGYIGINMSVGIGQIRMTTAEKVEKKGYIPLSALAVKHWKLKTTKMIYGRNTQDRYKRLYNEEINIYYVAAYLRYLQDIWEGEFRDIKNRPDILGTLYNIGSERAHPYPKSNEFGDKVMNIYYTLKFILNKYKTVWLLENKKY